MSNFHSDWVTIGRHRVFIACRTSFPDEGLIGQAEYAVRVIEQYATDEARLVQVYYDDKVCVPRFDIASTNDEDGLPEHLCEEFAQEYDFGISANVLVVPKRAWQSDKYCHMQYLSEAAGVYRP